MAKSVEPPAPTRRWTRVEYERLVELGVFQPGERHAAAIRRAVAVLRGALGDDWQIDSQLPIALDEDSEPEPDVSVVPR
jgi:hypothetical protein